MRVVTWYGKPVWDRESEMADHIPFVYTQKDGEIVKKFFHDSVAVRLSLHTVREIASMLPSGIVRWIDPAIDGLHWPKAGRTDEYTRFVSQFPGYDQISSERFQARPEKT